MSVLPGICPLFSSEVHIVPSGTKVQFVRFSPFKISKIVECSVSVYQRSVLIAGN